MQKQTPPTSRWFDTMSDFALIGIGRIVKTPDNPEPLIDTSRSTWWRWVADGTAPKPVRPAAGTTLWRVGDLRRWLSNPEEFLPASRIKKNRLSKRLRSRDGDGPAVLDQDQSVIGPRSKIAVKRDCS